MINVDGDVCACEGFDMWRRIVVERFVCQDGICFDEVKAKDRQKDREKTDFVLFGKKSNFVNTTVFFFGNQSQKSKMLVWFFTFCMCICVRRCEEEE